MRIYLAGPDVFHPEAEALGAAKKAICAEFGLQGVFPLDETVPPGEFAPRDHGLAIAAKDIRLLRSCDAALVNLSPYLGPSMDAGTAVELGLIAGLGLPAFGYSCDPRPFETRAAAHLPAPGWRGETFGLCDNLMVEGALAACGGRVFLPAAPCPFEDTAAFRRAAEALARHPR
ncbi:nucleoside 2-deoxyribosyltransferase [Mangrovicoccus algicola]|uniref:Nucleoside 2-deoxyribosyltransferase n=1 Tax=Mangrovicoccus algicola TaxID=2771008 RepID=A0A8J7CY14_9RHOB|nr:nucleoside 2-deoxyribosyltransferase [Mangrovicoccus algicola]MBE3640604.1 nucleoside 2-deoxyribosyltransferase [Mangrovicoccus algicola]